ncbi:MAG: GGDEF domain-containing protein [Rhodoferax sp.]|nr:GGDEF domain-containing protein [Rhodoferax sp.]
MRFLGSIHIAVGILLLTIGLGFYADLKTEQMHGQNVQIQVGLERLVRLNQSLTSAISLAVTERNSLRAASYNSLQTELEATMKKLLALTSHMTLAADMLALTEEQRELRAMENQAFAHMREDRWAAAHQDLLGGNYVMALKLYEINSESVVGALNIELTNAAWQQDQLRQASVVLRLAAAVLLLWAGWRYSSRLKAELAEQVRLRAEVTQAKEVLEETVKSRTAELWVANSQLETLSTTDSLTGLANRRRFDSYWAEEWGRAQRQATPLGVIMLDVDHFKLYNDHYGHQQGDACLQRVGEVLCAAVRRAGELAARYGGEEFVVVVPGASSEQILETAQLILTALRALQTPHASSPVANVVTASLGVASGIPRESDSPDRLLKAADVALYEAKSRSRNCVVLSHTA